ncbi:uncharacterized protein [Fopius arisanus]|uniref:Uncharacterized protein n=1 Tax=Fopius arisanus TaxID=64838 RepID=A0A9R1TYD5_9HYME|nr:PREDICTED: uncharacterized protein LOC105266135 [Fopius arisanus]
MKNKADEGFSSDEDGLEKSARVQKVSIVTKKTPEHIYRTEKIDKDGVRGTFITIIPNNSTDEMPDSVSMEDPIHDMDIQRMDPEILQDERISEHFLASLLMHAPPPESDWSEGSGEIEENESNSDIEKSEVTYIKEPDQRLYSYVEDIE